MIKIWHWIKSVFSKPQLYLRFRVYSIFKELSSYDLFLLDERMHQRKFKSGEVIFEAGYPLEVIYFVRSGEILLQGIYHGKEEKIIGKTQHLGILDMYHAQNRSSTAIAKTEVEVDAISRIDLLEYIQARPRCGLKILHAVCRDFCDLIFEQAGEKEQ
jgi:CRP/FNR family transcriptional regulator, cyclic AMP receptor protein